MLEDRKIIELFFARSEQAAEELSVKYGKLIRNIARNILNDEEATRECENDTYLGVWRTALQRPRQKKSGRLRNWEVRQIVFWTHRSESAARCLCRDIGFAILSKRLRSALQSARTTHLSNCLTSVLT